MLTVNGIDGQRIFCLWVSRNVRNSKIISEQMAMELLISVKNVLKLKGRKYLK